jgi:HD-GYP domain-containing protein (c-di-GMP phosphodiesterase class II)
MRESETHERLVRILFQLTSAIASTRLYTSDHPFVGENAETAYVELMDLLRITKSMTFFLVGDHIVLKDRPLLASSPFVGKFVVLLKEKGIERVTFDEGITKTELLNFIVSLATKGDAPMRSSSGIRLGKVELRIAADAQHAEDATASAEKLELASKLIAHGDAELDRIKELYLMVQRRKRIDVRGVDDIVRRFITGFLSNINPISLLASVKLAHEYTFTHAVNVGILTIIQARNIGFSGRVLHEIGIASMLHDVGKIFIPDDILSKPGRLTPEERAVIETHAVKGGRYLMTLEGIPKIAVLAAMEHHCKFDGTGYPIINPGWKPNIVGQMIAIADVFDALRSRRSYSEPKPLEEILKIFQKDRGVAFNPLLVDNFLQLIAGNKTRMGEMTLS